MQNISVDREIKPRKSTFKRIVVTIGFWALGRALQSLSHFDKEVKSDLKDWPENFKISLNVLPLGPYLLIIKKKGKLKLNGISSKNKHQDKFKNANLIVEIKNIDTAFRMIIAQWGVHEVYAQHKTAVIGNVVDAMKFIRMIYAAEDYLFPPFMSKNILKRLKKNSFSKFVKRMRIYFLGLFFGI